MPTKYAIVSLRLVGRGLHPALDKAFCFEVTMGRRRNTPESFWKQVSINAPNACWEWTGLRDGDGYGRTIENLVAWQCHRYAWTITNGTIPNGLKVLHRCDNPPCCNPSHLFLGTPLDNNRDRAKKGRNAPVEKIWMHQHPESVSGENNGNAKLTQSQAIELRALRQQGATVRFLMSKFGLSETQVYRIIKNESWTG